MNEKINNMQITGPKRTEILKSFEKQITDWGLAMPSAEPLVWDFGLGKFEQVGLIEYWIINNFDAGYCGKFLFVFDNQTCPMHSHEQKHETFFVLKGQISVIFNNQEKTLDQGQVLDVPTEMKHSFRGIGNAIVLEISKPCNVNDNKFEDSQIMNWLESISV